MDLKTFLKKVERKIVTTVCKTTHAHPSSGAFITGDGFRVIADAVFDADSDFDPTLLAAGSIVFADAKFLDRFFNERASKIRVPYILITHNWFTRITPDIVATYAPHLEKIQTWYAQNVEAVHEKIVPIPIGLENLSYYISGIPREFKALRATLPEKIPYISYGFTTGTNAAIREPALAALKQTPTAQTIREPDHFKYISSISNAMFVASPEGAGTDCHRTWEALYLKCIPIVDKTVMSEYFRDVLKLPIIIVSSWQEVQAFDTAKLTELYMQHKDDFERDELWMPYWKNRLHTESAALKQRSYEIQ